jgi:hypothetical protein
MTESDPPSDRPVQLPAIVKPIATLTYGFARIGAVLKMRVEDLHRGSYARVEAFWLHFPRGHRLYCRNLAKIIPAAKRVTPAIA